MEPDEAPRVKRGQRELEDFSRRQLPSMTRQLLVGRLARYGDFSTASDDELFRALDAYVQARISLVSKRRRGGRS